MFFSSTSYYCHERGISISTSAIFFLLSDVGWRSVAGKPGQGSACAVSSRPGPHSAGRSPALRPDPTMCIEATETKRHRADISHRHTRTMCFGSAQVWCLSLPESAKASMAGTAPPVRRRGSQVGRARRRATRRRDPMRCRLLGHMGSRAAYRPSSPRDSSTPHHTACRPASPAGGSWWRCPAPPTG